MEAATDVMVHLLIATFQVVVEEAVNVVALLQADIAVLPREVRHAVIPGPRTIAETHTLHPGEALANSKIVTAADRARRREP